MKNIIWGLVVVVALVGGFFAFNAYIYQEKQGDVSPALDYKNATYVIDGRVVPLIDGLAEQEAVPGAASKIVTRYFGNELNVDLDEDGREDVVFLVTQETGGSGVFFYAVAALNKETGYAGSEGYFLGDRIAPQTTNLSSDPNHKKVVVINYADHAPGESMSDAPSMGVSAYIKLDLETMQWGEVIQNFEGGANPEVMTLDMKTWGWESALYNDGTRIVPDQKNAFTLTFIDDDSFSATTDCNSMSGSYETEDDGKISFSQIAMTKKFCQNSQESDFAKILENTVLYHFTSKGELVFDLKFDSGSAIFR